MKLVGTSASQKVDHLVGSLAKSSVDLKVVVSVGTWVVQTVG